ncbi:hypothetical protein MHU86_7124 [Fragilaria crotonensis]|nr:hypothetical protein MHU86_7124 [Fragilaria crotonensis]
MDEVSKAAIDVGMTPDQGRAATGGVMAFLKHHLPKKQFKTIEAHMPGAELSVKTHMRGTSEGGGGTGLSGMFGGAMSAFGGKQAIGSPGGAAGLMALLASKGISPTMVQKFLGKVGPLIKKKCGVDVTQCLGGIAGAGVPTATATAATKSLPDATAPAVTTSTASPAVPGSATAKAAVASTGDAAHNLMGKVKGAFTSPDAATKTTPTPAVAPEGEDAVHKLIDKVKGIFTSTEATTSSKSVPAATGEGENAAHKLMEQVRGVLTTQDANTAPSGVPTSATAKAAAATTGDAAHNLGAAKAAPVDAPEGEDAVHKFMDKVHGMFTSSDAAATPTAPAVVPKPTATSARAR